MKHKSERGQSLVELGISLLILLYLLSGAAEFGVLFFQFVQLRDAAQEGALYGSSSIPQTGPTSDTWTKIETRARAASNSPIDLADPASNVTVSVYVDSILAWQNGAPGDSVPANIACEGHGIRVTVDFDHRIFMPFLPQILGRSDNPYIPLSATVVDTILTPVCP
jgi:Flp pilus assembly protein TadG